MRNTAGVDFTAECAAAQASGMSADSVRRTAYAADMSPVGA